MGESGIPDTQPFPPGEGKEEAASPQKRKPTPPRCTRQPLPREGARVDTPSFLWKEGVCRLTDFPRRRLTIRECRFPALSFRAKARNLFRSRSGKGCEDSGELEAPCFQRNGRTVFHADSITKENGNGKRKRSLGCARDDETRKRLFPFLFNLLRKPTPPRCARQPLPREGARVDAPSFLWKEVPRRGGGWMGEAVSSTQSLPQWRRQRYENTDIPKRRRLRRKKGSQPRFAALGSPFQGKGLAWTLPLLPEEGGRMPLSPYCHFERKREIFFVRGQAKDVRIAASGKHRAPSETEGRCFMQTALRKKTEEGNEKDPSAALGMTKRGNASFHSFSTCCGSQPRLAALGSPFQGKGLAWILPPSYGRRCPEGAEVGWGKRYPRHKAFFWGS